MKGATEYYHLIKNAYKEKISNLRKLKLKYGWKGGDSEAFIKGNFVFVTSTHARGECFHIYLIDKYETDEDIKNKAIEVYGIVKGDPGWTEEYGWLHDGKWNERIVSYFKLLENDLEHIKRQKLQALERKQELENVSLKKKLDEFNEILA